MKNKSIIGYMLHKESIEFIWDTPEFEFKEKSKAWYWGLGIIALLLIVFSIFLKNYLFGFLILVGVFLMVILSKKEPITYFVEISQRGIKIHNEIYPYQNIQSFWIGKNDKEEPLLLVKTNKKITPIISTVISPDIDIVQLRNFLLNIIEEEEMQEPFTDKLIDKIGF